MLACIASMSIATSCSKDNEELIVGKWQVTSAYLGSVSLTTTMMELYRVGDIYEFSESGEVTMSFSSGKYNSQAGTYKVSGDDLSITLYGDEVYTVKIKSLDKKEASVTAEVLGKTIDINLEKK